MGESGDADERESDLGSSRTTLQAELESEFSAPEIGALTPACDTVSVEGIGAWRSLSELPRSQEAAVGRAHHVPDTQHLVEGDDNRRRAALSLSTPSASLQQQGGNAHLFTTSSTLPHDVVVQIDTVLPSILQCKRLMSLSLYVPKLGDCCSHRFSHSGGLVDHEFQARVPMLWVLPGSMLILDVAHDLFHPRQITHV